MKKISFAVAISLILSMVSPAFAESELEAVITDVKSRIEIKDYESFDSQYYESENGKRVYHLWWSNDSEENFEYAEVSYSDGFISSYSYSENRDYDNNNKFPTVSVDEAETIAKEFVKKVNPEYADRTSLINSGTATIGGRAYYFDLQRFEQGFPVKNETGVIRIDKETGKVIYYNMSLDTDAEFPVIGEPIHYDDAVSEYKEQLAPKLQYASYYNYQTKENSIFLEYVSNENGKRINALSGSVIDLPENYDGDLMKNMATAEDASAVRGSSGGSLSAAEVDEIEKVSGLISKEDIEKLLRKNDLIALSEKDVLTSVSLNTYYTDNEKYYYSMRFSDENDKYTNVSINAANGEIISFSKRSE
ncbi:MAG: hypothetical protein IJ366_06865, partial [Clostridia bacterium]|nr:hypothetical protein [Clostridia bacterium]